MLLPLPALSRDFRIRHHTPKIAMIKLPRLAADPIAAHAPSDTPDDELSRLPLVGEAEPALDVELAVCVSL